VLALDTSRRDPSRYRTVTTRSPAGGRRLAWLAKHSGSQELAARGADKQLPYFPLTSSRNPTELSTEGKPFDPYVPVGAMIEIPSAALMALSNLFGPPVWLSRRLNIMSLKASEFALSRAMFSAIYPKKL
jgi:hypothetical protein